MSLKHDLTILRPRRLRVLPRRAMAAARARRADIHHAVRVMVAVGASYLLASMFQLPQGFWAVFTAIIVVQTSIGGTLSATFDRLIGTIVGAAAGAAAAIVKLRFDLDTTLVLCAVTAATVLIAAGRPKLKVAPITAVIVIIATPQELRPWHAAFYRVVEIIVGGVVGVAATLFIFPARAHSLVVSQLAGAMDQLADVLRLYARVLQGERRPDDADQAHRQVRDAMAKIEAAVTEARLERDAHLSERTSPERPPRVLWRVRNDTVMVERALSAVEAGPALDRLRPEAVDLLHGQATALNACAKAAKMRHAVVRADLLARQAALEAVVQQVRDERVTVSLSADAAAGLFGLVFALSSLTDNLEDLADAVDELALADQPTPTP